MPTTFVSQGLRGGVWSGMLTGSLPVRVLLILRGEAVAEAAVTTTPDGRRLDVRIPADRLAEGAQTFLLVADTGAPGSDVGGDGQIIGRLPIVAGEPLADDLGAEIALMRAELDLLKRELRRLATSG